MCPGAPRRCQRAGDPWRCSAAGQASTRISGHFGGGAAQSRGRAPFFGGGLGLGLAKSKLTLTLTLTLTLPLTR